MANAASQYLMVEYTCSDNQLTLIGINVAATCFEIRNV